MTAGPRAAAASSAPAVPVVVVLGALSAFGPLSMDMYLPALPSIGRDLSASTSAAQLTITACMVGLAIGQVVTGPISDAHGRRRPLLAGLVVYTVASALCALAGGIWTLMALRLVQGAAGAAGIVIARAVVRDVSTGVAAARLFALLMAVNGAAPVVAPLFGGQLLHVADWRGIFVALAAIGALMTVAASIVLPETLPAQRRHRGGLRAAGHGFATVLRDRAFVSYTLSMGLAFGAMASYLAGSPFVLQEIYGVSPQLFSALFAVNAIGLVGASQVSRRLVGRVAPGRLLEVGLFAGALGGAGLLASVLLGAGLAGVLPSLFVEVASIGLVLPNAPALALAAHPRTAGSAAGLIGLTQFAIGASVAPLVGLGGSHSALPMAIGVAALAFASVLVPRPRPGEVERSEPG